MKNDLQEKKELCSKILLYWFLDEENNPKMDYKPEDEEFLNVSFTANIILNKFKVFDIKIHLPVHLLMILSLCVNENPGQFQIILKDLLLSIKAKKGPIPEGYVITTNDFTSTFPFSFPIIEIPSIESKYRELWDKQKKETRTPLESDNQCDVLEWWKEVMQ